MWKLINDGWCVLHTMYVITHVYQRCKQLHVLEPNRGVRLRFVYGTFARVCECTKLVENRFGYSGEGIDCRLHMPASIVHSVISIRNGPYDFLIHVSVLRTHVKTGCSLDGGARAGNDAERTDDARNFNYSRGMMISIIVSSSRRIHIRPLP